MGIPTAYFSKIISGNPVKTDTGTLLRAGNASPSLVNDLSLIENLDAQPKYGSKPALAVSPNSSGNIGTAKIISGGTFVNLEEGRYVAKLINHSIAGTASTFLKSGAADTGLRRPVHKFYGYQRLAITSFNAVTGDATFGANNGVTVLASGIDGTLGKNADHAYGPPGELTFFHNSLNNATNFDYKTSTNP